MSNRCQVASSKRLGARNKEQVTRTGLGTVCLAVGYFYR